jgi:hypothetical protein
LQREREFPIAREQVSGRTTRHQRFSPSESENLPKKVKGSPTFRTQMGRVSRKRPIARAFRTLWESATCSRRISAGCVLPTYPAGKWMGTCAVQRKAPPSCGQLQSHNTHWGNFLCHYNRFAGAVSIEVGFFSEMPVLTIASVSVSCRLGNSI